jgi:hypothetical protein
VPRRLLPAVALALLSALAATWAYDMTSGQTKATFGYALVMTLAYLLAFRLLGARANIAAVTFAVALPAILASVRLLGHEQRQWVTGAIALAAFAAGLAYLLSGRYAAPRSRDPDLGGSSA